MALNDFTDQNIQDTYQKVVQTDGTNLADGTGSLLPIKFNGLKQSIEGLKISHESIGEAEIGTSFMVGPGLHVEGHIIATGDVIAHQYIVSSSVINVTTQQLSGSTKFGNSADDTHDFIGHITASGNISASEDLTANNITGVTTIESTLYTIDGINAIDYVSDTHLFGSTAKFSKLRTQQGLEITAPVTASGDISSSKNLIAHHITASGDISASGDVYASNLILPPNGEIAPSVNNSTIKFMTKPPGTTNNGETVTIGQDLIEFKASPTTTSPLHSYLKLQPVDSGQSEIIFNDGNQDINFILKSDNETAFKLNAEHDMYAMRNHVGIGNSSKKWPTSTYVESGTPDKQLMVAGLTHLTGSVEIIGPITTNITSSGNLRITGSTTTAINLDTSGHITASGNISASGTITAEHIVSSDDIVASGELFTNGTSVNKIAGILTLGSSNVPGGGNNLLVTGTSTFTSHITASGNISSSGIISTAILNGVLDEPTGLEINGYLSASAGTGSFTTMLYSSGQISASGVISGEGLYIRDDAEIVDDLTLGGSIIFDGNTITGINDSGEFDDDDAHIMTSAGINDRFALINADTTGTAANVTGIVASANLDADTAHLSGTQTFTGTKTFNSFKGTGGATVTNILDEDAMDSNSATALATQQSIKAYTNNTHATVQTGKNYRIINASFRDDIGTDKHYLPLKSQDEQILLTREEGIELAVCDGRLVSATVRVENIATSNDDFELTIGVETNNVGDAYSTFDGTSETETLAVNTNDDHHLFHFVFDTAKHWDSTDMFAISIQSSEDHWGSNERFFVTLVIEDDWSTYLAGSSREIDTTP